MARLLFVPMSYGRGTGPLIDCLSVAKEVAALGHDVAFLCRERFMELTKAAGFKVYPTVAPFAPATVDSDRFYIDFPAFQGLDQEQSVRETLKSEFAAMDDFKPDAVFSWLQFTTAISAKVAGVPIASVARWTGHPKFTSPLLGGGHFPKSDCTPVFNRILAEYGLPEIDDIWELDFLRSDLKIVTGTPELEPDLSSLPHLYYVGYLVPLGLESDFPDQLKTWALGHPTVFIYLSNKQFAPDKYVPITKAAYEKSEFRVFVAVGASDICPELPESTDNVRFERWFPIDGILSISDVVVSTATRGTAWQAALQGVVQLAFPGRDPELDFIGRMVEGAGAGLRMPDEAFSPESLLTATRQVLNPTTKKCTQALGNRLRSLGGPKRAAELFIKLGQGRL